MHPPTGTAVTISGGYDFEPQWLGGKQEVEGHVEKWIPGQNTQTACVVRLDEFLTATGDVRGKREQRTGVFVVLELRYVGQEWEHSGTAHVELCDAEPDDRPWSEREVGAWVESHATYAFAG
ncbi:hypothetical protein G7072_02920 [Nocardioides sp. HDW12B]|uniref:hypothetical protein n=1 Tax=Nocardioides sp. HDW12B TaxID=2714939 RepID=UPI00140B01EE|nr:hypothetical protein [Nocardioides sp. HDW12B]QIK65430.1 hypothetical protein G7072_02920 [Nocardioides sp. HDW12B]